MSGGRGREGGRERGGGGGRERERENDKHALLCQPNFPQSCGHLHSVWLKLWSKSVCPCGNV